MPELPEVETVRRRLLTCLPGLLLREVVVNDWTVSVQTEQELNGYLAGRRVTGLRRRGKYLLVDVGPREEDGPGARRRSRAGRSRSRRGGDRRLRRPFGGRDPPAHDRPAGVPARSRVSGRRASSGIWSRPPRSSSRTCAGSAACRRSRRRPRTRTSPSARWARSRSGPTSRSPICASALRDRRAPLKAFLLDQRRIAGVGNIYADEALFRARLHPLRAAGSVGPREAQRLHAAVLETLQAGIDHEGSSIESFIDPAGQRGSFQEILSVYQRTGEPCRVCGTTVERVVVGGRGTHYCPRCQPRRGGMAPGSRRQRGETTPPRSAKPADWEAPDR